jgi:hypothetical protein
MSIKKLIYLFVKAIGIDLLNKKQTETLLKPYQIASNPATPIPLPGVLNQADLTTLLFEPTEASTDPAYIWRYQGDSRKQRQLPYGAILTYGQVLCTDFDSYHLVKNFLLPPGRVVLKHPLLIAPWTHYLDGLSFGGYYDFVILVAAKLCRIKEALPAHDFAEAVVAYPLFKTTYEREMLELIGFQSEHILDSRVADIKFDECILGNSGHWFFPNPADIMALKKHVEKPLNIRRTEHNRIYISRAGRRRIVNEEALIDLLRQYDFLIIEDKPRSVAEQITIYKNASFIIGPHGASFTNVIWCEPGTHLVELFSASMVVGHFWYLSQLMNMTYSAYAHVLKVGNAQHYLEDDIFVSIADIEKMLSELFQNA